MLHSAFSTKSSANSDNNNHAESKPDAKLIFAPGANSVSEASQAAQFTIGTLHRLDLSPSPITQFHQWFTEPLIQTHAPETCTLSTASLPSGRVSSRMVYLKELESSSRTGSGGFVIYSNFGTSQKSKDLATNSWASLVFWWKPMERQVRVEGRAERLSNEESQKYYDTRARGSRIGAWASRQSEVLKPQGKVDGRGGNDDVVDDGRSVLEGWVNEVEHKFEGQENIPVPDFWGGLRIVPESVEFWQGRESRLHDRFRYTRAEPGSDKWEIERLSP